METNIKENLQIIYNDLKNINKAVTLVAVSKTISTDNIKIALDCGIENLGENKVQEMQQKFDVLNEYVKTKNQKIFWHLLGHLQTNKVKKAVKMADLIHSVDSTHLLDEINKEAKNINKIQNILIQVNISMEETKTGFDYDIILNFFDEIIKKRDFYSNIKILGLMVMGPLTNDKKLIENCFIKGNNLFNDIKSNYEIENFCKMEFLSMGMSSDYLLALKHNSNMIRIGQNIFGKREYNK